MLEPRCNSLELVSGVHAKRRRKKRIGRTVFYDRIKYVAFEGTSLSLLGLIKYDTKKDTFVMTKLACILAGGIKEAMQVLNAKIASLNQYRDNLIKLGFLALGMGAYFFFQWCLLKRNIWYRRGAESINDMKHGLINHSENCYMCMEHPAIVVFVPCNHLLVCKACCTLLEA